MKRLLHVFFLLFALPVRIYNLARNGKVLGHGVFGRALKEFAWLPGFTGPTENDLYAADNSNRRVRKLILHPEK